MTTYFLVDNNVLNRLPHSVVASKAFFERCRVPAEVAYEARDSDYAGLLHGLEIPVTIEILRHVTRIMASEVPGDRDLVDLFHNRGGADPLLIATALKRAGAQGGLWDDIWVVVSEDERVISKAREFGVPTLNALSLREQLASAAPSGGA